MASAELVDQCPKPKKVKLNDSNDKLASESIHDSVKDLSGFKLKRILQNNTNRKSICLTGTFDSKEGNAVVILEKTSFAEESLNDDSEYFTEENYLEKEYQNDIYGSYKYFPIPKLNSIKTTIIHPATEKHIQKFSVQKVYIVDETPQIYGDIVLPHLTREQFNLQWIFNILEHKSETARVICEDDDPINGFIMVPDLKWNGNTDTLYLLAIVHRRNIKSLRDLTGEHLALLKNIKQKGIDAIKEKYGLDSSQLRIYFHYQPTFYHLHVHFRYLRHEAQGLLTENAHLLSNVISNIELLPDYYQNVTLPFVVREHDTLFNQLEKNGILKKL